MSNILIAGGSGLIGQRLSELLAERGHTVAHLSRSKPDNSPYTVFQWNPAQREIEAAAIRQADYVINLAGAGIADKPWTAARKELIIRSRTDSARLLQESFTRFDHQPKAYISASAIGYYGSRGDEWLDEEAGPGIGFLSESTLEWEKAVEEVSRSGIRTVAIRIGIVLSTQGGAMEKMLLPFNLGVGTYFGNGSQWYSWIHIDDLCGIFIKALEDEAMQGIFNGVAPAPATNKALVEEMKAALGRPALIMPAPAFALRLAMGEMADVILFSARASARKLQAAGFEFRFPHLLPALKDLLGRKV
jgi:uncharacterized protein